MTSSITYLPSAASTNDAECSDAVLNLDSKAIDPELMPEQSGQHAEWEGDAGQQISVLTPRQHQIMDLVLAGKPSKNIAIDLGISQRTVENHRAAIMLKTGSKSIPALARLALMSKMTISRPANFTAKLSLA